jgi:hypothetical protein
MMLGLRTPFVFLLATVPVAAQEPDARNTLHILPIWDALMRPDLKEDAIRTEMDRLTAQCGKGNRFHKLGFSFIYPGNPETLQRNCRLAQEKGLHLGVIIGLQTHGNAGFAKRFTGDLRNFQWRTDGQTWNGGLETLPHRAPLSSSRYCDEVRKATETEGRKQAREILAAMKEFPGVIAVVNPLIEQGLGGGKSENGTLIYNDCGPYTTTEFRDWLRHTGRYDADGGAYAGQGAPEAITGPHPTILGKRRSPFYDDADPNDANGTGKSFNRHFGTGFASWKLRYYDLDANPDALKDAKTNPMPGEGKAFVGGGFQIPAPDPLSPFWRAWTWVNQEQGGKDPPGTPAEPAFGFAQVMSRNFVNDFAGWLIEEGLPKDRIYAHQVPTEELGDSPTGLMQARTMGMGIWTGYIPKAGTVGITRFGSIDPKRLTRYAPHWGIFEWHPQPGAGPKDQRLYDAAKRDLENYSANGCRFLFPGWWHPADKPDATHTKTFPLPDSRFTEAIRDFLAARKDEPLN